MIRYVMSCTVPDGRQDSLKEIVDNYFDDLHKQGPGGMRSQCYADDNDDCTIIHIKSFKKESIANHHFKSALFRGYIENLELLCGKRPGFLRLHPQQTFESIY